MEQQTYSGRVRILAGAHIGRVVRMDYENARRAIRSGTAEQVVDVAPVPTTTDVTPKESTGPKVAEKAPRRRKRQRKRP